MRISAVLLAAETGDLRYFNFHLPMNNTLLFLLFSLSSLLLASCSHSDPPEPEPPQTAAKSILVFMPYTANDNGAGSLYRNLLVNLNDMEQAVNDTKGLGGTRLIVFIAQDDKTSHLIDFAYRKGRCVRDTLKTYTSADYTTPGGLSSVIADMKSHAPADNYSMIVGCHGEGWLPAGSATRWFGGAKYKIDITTLAQAIQANGIKMQYILFDDCYMSAVEVAYDLRSAADWIIASTSEMMDYGMPYRRIMRYLAARQPDYQAVCDEFIAFYKSYRYPYATIGVTDLSRIGEMAALMKSVNVSHTFDESLISDVQDLDARHYTPTVYFDFGSYAKRLCGADTDAYSQYAALLGELVPYKAATDYIYSYSGKATEPVIEFSGLTVSDPSLNSVAVDTKTETAWWKATH